MENDDLTDEEKKRFNNLSRAAMPPASLEDKIVRRLAAEGEIRNRKPPFSFVRLAAGLVASVIIFLLGWFTRGTSYDDGYDYVLLLHQPESFAEGSDQSRVLEYTEWAKAVAERGSEISGEKLGESLMVSSAGLTESWNSPIGGFFMIRGTRDHAIEIAQECPHLKYRGSIEVRKIE